MSKRKKICSITTVDITMEPFVITQMQYMMQKGWDVTIVCNMTPSFIERIPDGIHYYNLPMERSFNLWVALKSTYKLWRFFRKERFDIVQYAATHAALYSSFASFISQIPIRIHLQWGIYNFSQMGLKGYFFKFVEWLTCKFSTDIRPVSHKNLDVAVREGLFDKNKGKVLGLGGTVGVELKDYPLDRKDELKQTIRERYGISQDEYVFGFCGRISVPKGNNELLRAFRRLLLSYENVALLMVGEDEGSVDRDLMAWASESDKVVMTGRVMHNQIPHYMAAMDCLVHPTYREGFGMVLQEALAMAVPIITTDIPGPSEVIENGSSGILVEPHDEQALYFAMNDAICNRKKYAEYGKSGRKRVEKYFAREIMLERIYLDREELYNGNR